MPGDQRGPWDLLPSRVLWRTDDGLQQSETRPRQPIPPPQSNPTNQQTGRRRRRRPQKVRADQQARDNAQRTLQDETERVIDSASRQEYKSWESWLEEDWAGGDAWLKEMGIPGFGEDDQNSLDAHDIRQDRQDAINNDDARSSYFPEQSVEQGQPMSENSVCRGCDGSDSSRTLSNHSHPDTPTMVDDRQHSRQEGGCLNVATRYDRDSYARLHADTAMKAESDLPRQGSEFLDENGEDIIDARMESDSHGENP